MASSGRPPKPQRRIHQHIWSSKASRKFTISLSLVLFGLWWMPAIWYLTKWWMPQKTRVRVQQKKKLKIQQKTKIHIRGKMKIWIQGKTKLKIQRRTRIRIQQKTRVRTLRWCVLVFFLSFIVQSVTCLDRYPVELPLEDQQSCRGWRIKSQKVQNQITELKYLHWPSPSQLPSSYRLCPRPSCTRICYCPVFYLGDLFRMWSVWSITVLIKMHH